MESHVQSDRLTRRRVCQTAVGVLAGSSIAGCSSSGPDPSETDSSDTFAPGETVDLDGLEVTYTGNEIVEAVRPVAPTPSDGTDREGSTRPETDTGSEQPTSTPITPADGGSVLAVRFRMHNGTGAATTAPMPKPAPVLGNGEIYVTTQRSRSNVSSMTVGARVEMMERTVPSLTHQLGRRQAELASGETVSGWVFYPLASGADISRVRIVIAGIEIGGATTITNIVRWRVSET